MLTVGFETDREMLAALYRDLCLDIPVGGANFVMRENGEPVGLMRAEVGDVVTITHFKVKNEGSSNFLSIPSLSLSPDATRSLSVSAFAMRRAG